MAGLSIKAWVLAGLSTALAMAAPIAVAQDGRDVSIAEGAGVRDSLTGARHPGAKNWRPITLPDGSAMLQRSTLLPVAQIACGFNSARVAANTPGQAACATLSGAQALADATSADGRKGAFCAASKISPQGYTMVHLAQFAGGGGQDTVITCLTMAQGMNATSFGFSQHEKEVRAFVAAVTVGDQAPAAQAPVAKGPAGAAGNTHADRVAVAVLAAAGDGPLTQASLPSLRKRIPMVTWIGGGGEMLAAGTFEGGDAYIEDLGLNAPGFRFSLNLGAAKSSLTQAQLLTALVARGAQVDRHACFSESSMFSGVMTQKTRDFIRVRNAAGRSFLMMSWTEKPARGVERVTSVEVETATALRPANQLDTYGRTPSTVPCPAWTAIAAPAPAAPKPPATPVATTEADRFAELVLAAAGSAPLKQVSAAALKTRVPQVKNWADEMEDMASGSIENFQFMVSPDESGAASISIDAFGPRARGSRSLPTKDALTAALVSRGAKVARHHCTQLFMTSERLTTRSDHLRVALAGGRQFLLTVATNIRDARSEEVTGLTVRTAASLPTAASLNAIFGSGTKLQACQ